MSVLPDCPRCGDNRLVFEEDDRGLWCNYCKIAFDNDPDEGEITAMTPPSGSNVKRRGKLPERQSRGDGATVEATGDTHAGVDDHDKSGH